MAGLHGSGRSTQARIIAEEYGLRYISTGTLFRERAEELGVSLEEMSVIAETEPELDMLLDERAREESRRGGVVIDASLSGWMAEDPDLRIFLTCPLEERMRRIADREGRGPGEVEEETLSREESERERFKRLYGADLEDLSIYDLVINTGLYDIDGVSRIIKKAVDEYIRNR